MKSSDEGKNKSTFLRQRQMQIGKAPLSDTVKLMHDLKFKNLEWTLVSKVGNNNIQLATLDRK